MTIQTKDIQLASFFRLKGYSCIKIEIDNYGQGIFHFNMEDNQKKDLGLEYGNSEHAPFEGIRRGLLKQLEMLKRGDDGYRRNRS